MQRRVYEQYKTNDETADISHPEAEARADREGALARSGVLPSSRDLLVRRTEWTSDTSEWIVELRTATYGLCSEGGA